MIQQVEEINNIPRWRHLERVQYLYAEAVKSEKERGITAVDKNPLVGKVKDYIFSHLHDKIKVADIAESLESIRIILRAYLIRMRIYRSRSISFWKKIRRSQNLLKYSDYNIQEIGFYLGFSSQSHFTRKFQEIAGMTPNE